MPEKRCEGCGEPIEGRTYLVLGSINPDGVREDTEVYFGSFNCIGRWTILQAFAEAMASDERRVTSDEVYPIFPPPEVRG